LLVSAAGLEFVCYSVPYYRNDIFSYEQEYIPKIDVNDFNEFISSPYFDPKIGWNNPVVATKTFRMNCVGETIEYNYSDGHRIESLRGSAVAALFGDSFAQGEEVGDDFTISSILTRKYHIPTINYGVNGYEPLQAEQKFENTLPHMSGVKVAILLIMHENIRRMVNSFPYVYARWNTYYALKPYMHHGRIVDLTYPTDFASFVDEVRKKFKEDFWARPERRFPYTVSLARALGSNAFTANAWSRVQGRLVHEYTSSGEMKDDLAVVIRNFVAAAQSYGMHPAVIFIPESYKTYKSSQPFVRSMNSKLGEVVAHEFVDDNMDWKRYNLGVDCHPSTYGYSRIADFIYKELFE
jgi:hypothetical protein